MKRIGIKLLKGIGILSLLALVGFGVVYLIYNEPLPEGKEGSEAQALLQRLNKAINKEAWDQTRYLQWSFAGLSTHNYLWDRQRRLVEIRWDNTRVLLNPSTKTGKVYEDGLEKTGEEAQETIETAYAFFTNDAFWLNGFVQIEQPGTKLRAVDLKEGGQGLLVTYTEGGITPGDSYLWVLDEQGLPKYWKMWVKIIPIGGIKTTWENWETLPTGAKLAKNHQIGPMNIKIKNLKSFQTLEEGGYKEDIFKEMNGQLSF